MKNYVIRYVACFAVAASVPILSGCNGRHAVVAVTGTVIGVEISQNPQTQMYQAKLGYNRGEVAIVPSNRSAKEDPGNVGGGAKDTTDVIMELKYSGIFSSNGGIYQRLAVGSKAVAQPGAAFMFAKDNGGALDSAKVKAISEALNKIPEGQTEVSTNMAPIRKAFLDLSTTKAAQFDAAAQKQGYANFQKFLSDEPKAATPDQIKAIRSDLEQDTDIKAKLAEIEKKP